MWIEGYIYQSEEEAFWGKVRIVPDIRFCAGEYVGYMDLTSGEFVNVKRHPCGTLNGQIVND